MASQSITMGTPRKQAVRGRGAQVARGGGNGRRVIEYGTWRGSPRRSRVDGGGVHRGADPRRHRRSHRRQQCDAHATTPTHGHAEKPYLELERMYTGIAEARSKPGIMAAARRAGERHEHRVGDACSAGDPAGREASLRESAYDLSVTYDRSVVYDESPALFSWTSARWREGRAIVQPC